MLKGKRLQSGKYIVEIDSKTKGKRRNKKPPSDKLNSLEKIQLHINRALGRPGPKTLPKLTDEEYLVLQSKMISLKNVKIGRSDFGVGNANTFATPIIYELLTPTFPVWSYLKRWPSTSLMIYVCWNFVPKRGM